MASINSDHFKSKAPVIGAVRDGHGPSCLAVDWSVMPGAVAYEAEWFSGSAMTPPERLGAATTTQSELNAGPLEPGRQYWFRIRAVRANAVGPWSDPATRIAGL